MTKRILHVVSNVSHYADPTKPTGLWLSELSHAHDIFAQSGFEQHIVSPKRRRLATGAPLAQMAIARRVCQGMAVRPGPHGASAIDPSPDDIDPLHYDAIYFTGGHAVMWDFPDSEGWQCITRAIWENGGIVSSVCHGYCGLLNTRLSDGSLLVMAEIDRLFMERGSAGRCRRPDALQLPKRK